MTAGPTLLAWIGLATVVALLIAILRKWLSPLVALILIPIVAGIVAGSGAALGGFIVDGIRSVAPVAAMFVFAILFFGVMTDAGLFAPFVNGVIRFAGTSPPRILVGTAILASIVHLDGSGATTFLVVVPAMLPLYDALGMERRKLACAVAMAAGVNNVLPWGGPTIRAATALNVDVLDIYGPLIPVHVAGLAFVVACAYWMGVSEAKRLRAGPARNGVSFDPPKEPPEASAPGWRFFLNVGITIAVVGVMVSGLVHPVVAFMPGLVAALVVNFPGAEQQRERVDAHARSALLMASILLAAGAFTGIMTGSGMLDAMATAGANLVPQPAAAQLPLVLAVISMPLSLLFDPDSFYFGVLPVLASVAEGAGASSLDVAFGALMGQMTTGFPVSPLTPATFLLVGLARVDLADHQRYAIPWLFATSLVMTVAAVASGLLLT